MNVAVTYPDPAAVGLTTWTQWKIPLNSLTGLNLAKVKKLYPRRRQQADAGSAGPPVACSSMTFRDQVAGHAATHDTVHRHKV